MSAPDAPAQTPSVLLFDVSETLSDLSPLGDRFVDVGAPDHLTRTWLATLLLDGMALTAARAQAHFGQLAIGTLRSSLTGLALNRPVDEAIAHIMAGFDELGVHSDVPAGLPALAALGPRLVTLTNAEASVSERLFGPRRPRRARRSPPVDRGRRDLEARTAGVRLRGRALPSATRRDDARRRPSVGHQRGTPRGTSHRVDQQDRGDLPQLLQRPHARGHVTDPPR